MTSKQNAGSETPDGQTLAERLRMRLLTSFHLGQLRAGDRLPSIRRLSREWRADPRRVMRAYHELAAEGLVEVRDRSGAYLAITDPPGSEDTSPGTASWMAELAMQSWVRRVPLPDLTDLVGRFFGGPPVRCVLVESVGDPMEGVAAELETDFGFAVTRCWTDPDPDLEVTDADALCSGLLASQPDDAPPDLVVATSFHTRSATAVADHLGVPLIIPTVNPEWVGGLRSVLDREGLTTIGVDPASEGRFRRLLEADGDPRFGFVAVEDAEGARRALAAATGPVYPTRAVRDLLGEAANTVSPGGPLLGPDSARRLVAFTIEVRMARSG